VVGITVEILRSDAFDRRLTGLRDVAGRARILVRLDRLAAGHASDHKGVGDRVLELRMTFGPGYPVYYMQRGALLVVLLAGGDKSSQAADIAAAKSNTATWE
jgi:putative addiction module killer protein